MMAYTLNWKGLHPFYYHKNDFNTPQQSEVPEFNKQQEPPDFGQLMRETFIDQPDSKTDVYVDERDGYKEAEFWETTAGWAILPDGGMVFRDGYGAEILMTGGNIHISCPGEVFMRPGRSFIAWGGDDVIIRAKKSMDLSTAEKNISIKAEQNLDMLSGNSGQGRTLIENRGIGIEHEDAGKVGELVVKECGVIVKAKWSEFATMSRRAYIRTGSSEGEVHEGDIVLDAARGKQAVRIIARELDAHLEHAAYLSYPAISAEKTAAYVFTARFCMVPCYTMIRGYLATSDHILCHGHLMAVGGHVITSVKDPHVFNFKTEPGPSKSGIEEEHELVMIDRTEKRQTKIKEEWWDRFKIGADAIQKTLEIGFRDTEQYATQQFRIPESYWQQWARTGARGNQTWSEPPVKYHNEDTFPYPGKEKWKDEKVFMEVDFQRWDKDASYDKDRPGPYEDPKIKWRDQKQKLEGYYQTITPK